MEFRIEQMSCNHCVQAVTAAVQEVDAQAKVDVDLASKRVVVDTQASRESVVAALEEAGYAPS